MFAAIALVAAMPVVLIGALAAATFLGLFD